MIVQQRNMPVNEERQTLLFSATFPSEIQQLAKEFLRNYVWIGVGRVGSTVEKIKQVILPATNDQNMKLQLLIDSISKTQGRTLVFVQRKKTAALISHALFNIYNVSAEEIHGDRSQLQRETALKNFRKGITRVLVATDVAARGLDIPYVTHVIQFDMPVSPEDFDVYIHRIGRTGRAGHEGLATSFFVPGKKEGNGKIAEILIKTLKETNQVFP